MNGENDLHEVGVKYKTLLLSAFFIVYLSIFINPVMSYSFSGEVFGFEVWFIGALLGLLLVAPFLSSYKRTGAVLFLFLFLFYISIHGVSTVYFGGGVGVALSLALFLVSAVLCFGVVKGGYWYLTRYDLREFMVFALYIILAGMLWQYISHVIGVPFPFDTRSRSYQMTGFFEEPAFLSLSLFALLYYFIFCSPCKEIKYSSFAFLGILSSQSLGGVLSGSIIIIVYVVSSFLPVNRNKIVTLGLLLLIGVPLSIYFIYSGLLSGRLYDRFFSEVLAHWRMLGADPVYGLGSGYTRTINELNYLFEVISSYPIFGCGIDYSVCDLDRTMALNAFVEVAIRWGLAGLVIVLLFIFLEKKRFPSRSVVAFWVFVLLYGSIDGAVAKPMFLLPLAFVFLAERVRLDSCEIPGYCGSRSRCRPTRCLSLERH